MFVFVSLLKMLRCGIEFNFLCFYLLVVNLYICCFVFFYVLSYLINCMFVMFIYKLMGILNLVLNLLL